MDNKTTRTKEIFLQLVSAKKKTNYNNRFIEKKVHKKIIKKGKKFFVMFVLYAYLSDF